MAYNITAVFFENNRVKKNIERLRYNFSLEETKLHAMSAFGLDP